VEKRNKKDDNGEGEVNWQSQRSDRLCFVWGSGCYGYNKTKHMEDDINLAGIENFRIVWRTS
jgi:hypothetical protein